MSTLGAGAWWAGFGLWTVAALGLTSYSMSITYAHPIGLISGVASTRSCDGNFSSHGTRLIFGDFPINKSFVRDRRRNPLSLFVLLLSFLGISDGCRSIGPRFFSPEKSHFCVLRVIAGP